MSFLYIWINQVYVVSYIPHNQTGTPPFELPNFPELINIERLLLLILLIILVRPILKKQNDQKLEKERLLILKLCAAAGGVALFIRFYRLLSGN